MSNLTKLSFIKTHKSDARMIRSGSDGQSPCCYTSRDLSSIIQRAFLNAPEIAGWTLDTQASNSLENFGSSGEARK